LTSEEVPEQLLSPSATSIENGMHACIVVKNTSGALQTKTGFTKRLTRMDVIQKGQEFTVTLGIQWIFLLVLVG
jgi:hypothetical protein